MHLLAVINSLDEWATLETHGRKIQRFLTPRYSHSSKKRTKGHSTDQKRNDSRTIHS